MDDLPFRVVAIDGRTWTVRELETDHKEWALSDRCLICEDGSVVRRFWVYPEDWRSIPSEELAAFCMFARPSTAPRPATLLDDQRADGAPRELRARAPLHDPVDERHPSSHRAD